MRGDKIIVEEKHMKAARQIRELLLPKIGASKGTFIITIAGESGSGKSEVAEALSGVLSEKGVKTFIFQQDDYFVYPPKTNAAMRRENIDHVGLSEVRLELLDRNLAEVMTGKKRIEKPLVIFEEDRITCEEAELEDTEVIIVEGTYTTLLGNAHEHIFIDQSYIDTREARDRRDREEQDEFLERVLMIEHDIISTHRMKADILVDVNFDVRRNEEGE